MFKSKTYQTLKDSTLDNGKQDKIQHSHKHSFFLPGTRRYMTLRIKKKKKKIQNSNFHIMSEIIQGSSSDHPKWINQAIVQITDAFNFHF